MNNDSESRRVSQVWFRVGCLVEGGLILVALGINALFRQPLWGGFEWDLRDGLIGLFAALPAFGLFLWMCGSNWKPLLEIRDFLQQHVLPIMRHWTIPQLAVISLLAGLGEELLFRGAIQAVCGDWFGELAALLIASIIFGLVHLITPAYGLAAASIGLLLGWLWLKTGNLLAPALTHAVYDFAALLYFVRVFARPPGAPDDD